MRFILTGIAFMCATYAATHILKIKGDVPTAAIVGAARIVDGDTITIADQRIRIAAIDACEIRQTGLKNGQEWPCGRIARQHLVRLIDRQEVSCIPVDRDKYGRIVGQCFAGGRDIGLEMVKAGYALTFFDLLPLGHPLDLNAYSRAQDQAEKSRSGQWAASIERPGDYRRSHPGHDG